MSATNHSAESPARSRRRGWWIEFLAGAAVFALIVGVSLSASTRETARSHPAAQLSFWELLHIDGAQYKWFGSLEEMTAESSVVVVGHIIAVSEGRVFIPEPKYADRASAHYLNARLQVDEVVHGALAHSGASEITIELFAPNVEAIPLVLKSVPTDTSMFFLLNKAVHPATANLPPLERAAEAKYYEIMGEQARLEKQGDIVGIPAIISDGEFPSNLAGRKFDDVLAVIQALP